MSRCASRALLGLVAAWAMVGMDPAGAAEPAETSPAEAQAQPAAPPSAASALADPEDDEPAADAPTVDGDPDEPMDVVTVIGRRREAARVSGSAHVLGEAALETFERDDIHRILAQVPGVYVRGEDGHGLRPNIGLRGASSDRSAKVTLMEDGILLGPAPYSAPAAYYFPLVTRMTRVEVFKGPASIRNGPNTIGGAVNMTTRAIPLDPAGGLDLSLGRFGAQKTHGWAGGTWRGFGVLAEGVRLSSDGFKALDGGGDTGFDKREAMLKLAWNSEGGEHWQRVQLKLGYADEVSDETYVGLSDADFDATPYRRYAGSQLDRMRWERTQVQLDYVLDLEDIQLVAALYRHDFHRSWYKLNRFRGADVREVIDNPDDGQLAVFLAVLRGELDSEGRGQALLVGDNDRTFASQGAQAAVTWQWSGDVVENELSAGVRLHADEIVRDHTEDAYLMRTGRLVSDGQPTETILQNRGSAEALAIYVVDELRVLDDLYLTPGGRVELIASRRDDRLDPEAEDGERTDTAVIGGFGAYYQATSWLGVLAGVHQGFSPVSPGQPSSVEPERSVNYEAGARFDFGSAGKGELIGFWNAYENLTAECTVSAGCDVSLLGQQFNAGAVDVYGLEAVLNGSASLGGGLALVGHLSYTLTLSEFGTSFISASPQFGEVEAGDALPYVPVHQGGLGLGLVHDRFGVDLEGTYVGEMRDTAGAGTTPAGEGIDAQWLLDAAAFYAPTGVNRIYLKVENVLDRANAVSRRPYGLRPGMPLNVTIGYKHRFGDE